MLTTLTLSSLPQVCCLLRCQSNDLAAAMSAAAAQAQAGNFAAAAATLQAAGAERSKDAAALTALGTYLLRDTEARAAAGTLQGLAAADLMAEANRGQEDATRLWYQGVFELNSNPPRWAAAKEHLERVMELNPAFTNTWYFLASGAMAEGGRLQQAGESAAADAAYVYAATAWGNYLKDFGANQIQAMAALEDRGQAFLEQVRWLEGKAINAGRAAEAARLADWRTKARPQDPEAWNNLGFFLREAGQAEASLSAYRKGLELAPNDPGLLNDTAVILHYYLRRDDAQAKRMYQQAIEQANAILANPGARSADQLQIVRIALRDATNNLARLEAGSRDNN